MQRWQITLKRPRLRLQDEFFSVYSTEDIEKLDQSSVVGVIDFDDYALLNNISEYQEGVYNCVLTLELPEGIRSSDSVIIQVRLRKNEE